MRNSLRRHVVLLSFTLLFAAACSSAATPTPESRPTVTPIPVYQYSTPTPVAQFATASAMTAVAGSAETELNPQAVERGRDRYVALECGSCHGENGEGTAEGSAVAEWSLTEDEFVSFMRSGGTLGADHQYSTNRLSDSGGRNLYQYLLSLNEAQ
jgi:mono/diheme cytochrome c family protein